MINVDRHYVLCHHRRPQ